MTVSSNLRLYAVVIWCSIDCNFIFYPLLFFPLFSPPPPHLSQPCTNTTTTTNNTTLVTTVVAVVTNLLPLLLLLMLLRWLTDSLIRRADRSSLKEILLSRFALFTFNELASITLNRIPRGKQPFVHNVKIITYYCKKGRDEKKNFTMIKSNL